ncbi:Tau-tubulin kinase 2 [Nowakowskiella sp. JEL0407]|nr:Tau-tubulin kinase 2 [Nowakowskiella sp. JEL0407]
MLTAAKDMLQQVESLHNYVIKGRWKIIDTVGKGAFGEVYHAVDLVSGQSVAIKIENPECKKPVLKLEISVLRKLQGYSGICAFFACGRFNHSPNSQTQSIYTYLVMELLGTNVSDLRKQQLNGQFSYATTALLGIQMLDSLEALHSVGIIHRDIKPGNFCMSLNTPPGERSRCYLIDFGLSRRYLTASGKVREPRQKIGFRGTARYASINAHLGMELGRVDDLWSLFYVILEFLLGQLPWKGKEKERIGEMKQEMNNADILDGLPEPIFHMYYHISSLEYADQPNYSFLRRQFIHLFAISGEPQDVPYDWDIPAVKFSPLRSNPVPVPSSSVTPRARVQIQINHHPDIDDDQHANLIDSASEENHNQVVNLPSAEQPGPSYSTTYNMNMLASHNVTTNVTYGSSPLLTNSYDGSRRKYSVGSVPTTSGFYAGTSFQQSNFSVSPPANGLMVLTNSGLQRRDSQRHIDLVGSSPASPLSPMKNGMDDIDEGGDLENMPLFFESPPQSPLFGGEEDNAQLDGANTINFMTAQHQTPHPPNSSPPKQSGFRFRRYWPQGFLAQNPTNGSNSKPPTQPIQQQPNYLVNTNTAQGNIPRSYQLFGTPQQQQQQFLQIQQQQQQYEQGLNGVSMVGSMGLRPYDQQYNQFTHATQGQALVYPRPFHQIRK